MHRQPEPELMDLPDEVRAYAEADFAAVNAAFVQRVVALAGDCGVPEDAAGLDLGCGPGEIAIRVARAMPGWRVAAADASGPMLAWAARAASAAGVGGRMRFDLQDAKRLTYPDGGFDLVFSNSLLHHITDAVAMWREVARVAKRGAPIFFRDLYRPADADTARRIVETHAAGASALLKEEFYRSLLSAYTPDEIRAQLSAAGLGGFTVETITDRHVDIVGRR